MVEVRARLAAAGRRVVIAVALLALLLLSIPASAVPAQAGGEKLALAFYYMWYGPDSFSGGLNGDRPLADYISDHADTIQRQIGQARSTGIDGFITSWWGRDDITDKNFALLLDQAKNTDFRATIYFEAGAQKLQGIAAVIDQLRYVTNAYEGHPNFLRYGGKPVIFFWRPDALGGGGAGTINAWKQVRDAVDPQHQQIWSAETTDVNYLDTFDGIHLFSAAKWAAPDQLAATDMRFRKAVDAYNAAHGTNKIWAAGAAPGYDDHRLPGRVDPVIPRNDGAYYQTSLSAALGSNPEWLTITSFNEWYEGTQIEPGIGYGTRYLDLTRAAISSWKGPLDPCAGGTKYDQTGFTMCRDMESYWQQYGGVAQFGYPLSAPHAETGADGKTYTVQYFERSRFELHPENAGTPYAVLLGQLGREFHAQDPAAAPINDGAHTFFPETGHNLGGSFRQYWNDHGGLFVNGYPLTEEIKETLADGKVYTVQYFERARFEYHPENAGTPYEVQLGFLGKMALAKAP